MTTEQRIAKTNAMLAAMEAAPTYSDYMTAFVALEQRLHGLPGMGVDEANKAWREFDRIRSVKSAQWRAEYNAAAFNAIALNDITAKVCGDILSTAGVDAARSYVEAAE